MGLIDATLCGIFAAKIANRLIDLGIDVKKIGPDAGQHLYEIERDKRKILSPHEAAMYFYSAALPLLDPACFLYPLDKYGMSQRGQVIIEQWFAGGKVREPHFVAAMKQLNNF